MLSPDIQGSSTTSHRFSIKSKNEENHRVSPRRRSSRRNTTNVLRETVVNCQGKLKEKLKDRDFYATRAVKLDKQLHDTPVPIPEQTITVQTLQVADMLVEIDDLRERIRELESSSTLGDTSSSEASKESSKLKSIELAAGSLETDSFQSERAESTGKSQPIDSLRRENNWLCEALKNQQVMVDKMRQENDRLACELKEVQLGNVQEENIRLKAQLEGIEKRHDEEIAATKAMIVPSPATPRFAEDAINAWEEQIKDLQVENTRMKISLDESEQSNAKKLIILKSKILSLEGANKRLQSEKRPDYETTQLQSRVRALEWDNQVLRAEKESMSNMRQHLDTLSSETVELRSQSEKDRNALMYERDKNAAIESQLKSLMDEVARTKSERKVTSLVNDIVRDHLVQTKWKKVTPSGEGSCESPQRTSQPVSLFRATLSPLGSPSSALPSPSQQAMVELRSKVEVLEEVTHQLASKCAEDEFAIAKLTEQLAEKLCLGVGTAATPNKSRHQEHNTNQSPRFPNLKWAAARLQERKDMPRTGQQQQQQQAQQGRAFPQVLGRVQRMRQQVSHFRGGANNSTNGSSE